MRRHGKIEISFLEIIGAITVLGVIVVGYWTTAHPHRIMHDKAEDLRKMSEIGLVLRRCIESSEAIVQIIGQGPFGVDKIEKITSQIEGVELVKDLKKLKATCLIDQYGRPYILQIKESPQSFVLTIISFGKNGNDDGGERDDLQVQQRVWKR